MNELEPVAAVEGPLQRFRRLVMTDAALQDQLWAVSEREAFVALAVALGESRGCGFTTEEVLQAMQAGRRTWIERWLP